MTTVVSLLSGGVDSATVLARMVEAYGNGNVLALSVNYGQRHDRELRSARDLTEHYGVDMAQVTVPNVFGSSVLTDHSLEVPDISYSDVVGISPMYVPFRNGILLSIATAFALSQKASFVAYGAHADDAAGYAYPDCTPEFIDAMGKAISEGTYRQVSLLAPYALMTKAEIISEGMAREVPYDLTWSCYRGGDVACGRCATCRSRVEAFEAAGYHDPIAYAVA